MAATGEEKAGKGEPTPSPARSERARGRQDKEEEGQVTASASRRSRTPNTLPGTFGGSAKEQKKLKKEDGAEDVPVAEDKDKEEDPGMNVDSGDSAAKETEEAGGAGNVGEAGNGGDIASRHAGSEEEGNAIQRIKKLEKEMRVVKASTEFLMTEVRSGQSKLATRQLKVGGWAGEYRAAERQIEKLLQNYNIYPTFEPLTDGIMVLTLASVTGKARAQNVTPAKGLGL